MAARADNMNYAETIQFLYDLQMFGAKFGLENTRRLAALSGDPHRRLRFIHVAGTNGKGSTCAMLESICRAAGLRVGLFTSPHLVSFAERIQVNRQPIPESEVVRHVREIQSLLPQFPDDAPPTFFEAVTVLALRHFAGQQCDLVIWETGLGGRLDATNIVTPLASVITNIGFDHQQWLGDTLEKIAGEKAGIIKPGVPVITAAEPGRGLEVIAAAAQAADSPLTVIDANDAGGTLIDAANLPLAGHHQRLNAALAIAVIRAVASHIDVPEPAILSGLSSVHWPGRMQIIQTTAGQTIVLDGAHNAASVAALRDTLIQQFPDVKPVLLLGVLADKDWGVIARTLAPLASRILLMPVNSQRTLPPTEMQSVCRAANPTASVEIFASLSAALEQSKNASPLVITGSLYLIGEAMELLHLAAVPVRDERGLNEWSASKP